MKKLLILTTVVAGYLVASSSSFAQGQIGFANGTTTRVVISNQVDHTVFNMYGAAGTYEFGLYIGHVGDDASTFTLVGTAFNTAIAASTTFNAGLFNGGNPFTLPTIAGFTDGSGPIIFQVKGWSASLGATYEAALAAALAGGNGVLGFSAIGQITPVVPPATVPNIFGTGAGQIGGFTLTQVPEPTTIALAGLGAASLLLFRRRK